MLPASRSLARSSTRLEMLEPLMHGLDDMIL
jgi:hypothetical protein